MNILHRLIDFFFKKAQPNASWREDLASYHHYRNVAKKFDNLGMPETRDHFYSVADFYLHQSERKS